ncbi:polysaccharide biosynthesis tyrosine autokinase [Corynebacterium ammoniagenes]|uniref:non-specific protein-tyrosine kinase n=1 Tax=Corynebacterium ammoniagenes TaxID=1697 RepID=A0AAV5G6W0_CORAM|nr:polysaccharide biosynthesis tyrosine autokinase [Corynebacterium ammoniagenes]GJN41995.1 chromosome partitioning protein [Corynebacterium ammoniagenes]
MELRKYLLILRKYWVLVVVATVVGLAAGLGLSFLMTPEYQAKTQLYVSVRSESGSTGDLVQGATFSRQIVNSYVTVVNSSAVLDPVAEELQLDGTGTELSDHITASSPAESALIDITASSSSPEEAATIANHVGESFKTVVKTQLEPETDGSSPISLTTTERASVPNSPVSPNYLVNIVLGLLVGLVVGFGVAILRTVLDRRLHSADDIAQITDRPLLGEIIDDPEADKNRIIVSTKPRSPRAESFRALRTNLQFLNVGAKKRVFVVSSSRPSEGKSTTSLNLAATLAQTGASVIVVEGDLRMPTFAKYLDIEGGAGLTDVLIGRAELVDVIQRWGRDPYYVLPAGRIPPNPSELLGTTEMEEVLETLRDQFDYVIIDAPPVLAVTDAVVLEKLATGLLMVVATGFTTRQELEDSMQVLETAGTNVLGVVATMVASKKPGGYSYGQYGYGARTVDEIVGEQKTKAAKVNHAE